MVRPTGRRFFCSWHIFLSNNDVLSDNNRPNILQQNDWNLPVWRRSGRWRRERKVTMSRWALLWFCLGPLATQADDELDAAFGRGALIIVASKHACYQFDVYLARDDDQRRRGLMFVRDLPPMTGMLFVYDGEEYHSMWMKNTYIPLDIVFARGDGTVSSVTRNTEPLSLASIASIEPVTYVLELNAGAAERFFIDANSHLLWEPQPVND